MTRSGTLLTFLGLLGVVSSHARSAPPVVDFGPVTVKRCLLGLTDDSEPLPTAWSTFRFGSIRLSLDPDGGMYVTTSPLSGCAAVRTLPFASWETQSEAGTKVLLRHGLEEGWSEPAFLADSDAAALDPSTPTLGTLRLSKGELREESTVTTTTRRRHAVLSHRPGLHRDGPPAMIENPVNHISTVVWARSSENGFDILSSSFRNGAWSEPVVVAGSRENELDPQLAVGPDGSIHLFYWVDGDTPRVLHRSANAELTQWSPPTLVSRPGEIPCRPFGGFHEGVLYVAYEDHPLGLGRAPRNIVLAQPEAEGFRSQVIAVTQNPEAASPRVHSEGGILWVDWDDGAGASAWTRMDASGRWESTRYETYASDLEREERARVRIRVQGVEQP
jgi:hypothetical protein